MYTEKCTETWTTQYNPYYVVNPSFFNNSLWFLQLQTVRWVLTATWYLIRGIFQHLLNQFFGPYFLSDFPDDAFPIFLLDWGWVWVFFLLIYIHILQKNSYFWTFWKYEIMKLDFYLLKLRIKSKNWLSRIRKIN